MRRVEITPRKNPYPQMEAQGFSWHHNYWREGAYYEFSNREVDEIEAATNGLWEMCLDLVYDVIDDDALLTRVGVPQDPNVRDLLRYSWENDHETLIGRFDFAWDGSTVRMFEFNADTPTSLLEAAVIQWAWFEELFGKKDGFDQFNTLHEKLVEAWKKVVPHSRIWGSKPTVHFTHMDDAEDGGTVGYLRDTASQAGYDNTPALWVEELGFEDGNLKGADGEVISHLFKLYPWENFFEDIKGNVSYLQAMKKVRSIEPAWKMILSSKGLLPLLWERHPGHPNLLESYFQGDARCHKLKNYVTKPLFSREGANVQIHAPSLGHVQDETPGGYSDHPKIVQEFFPVLPYGEGYYPTLGSWLINGEASGMGIRESVDLVAGNRSHFVPHIIFG